MEEIYVNIYNIVGDSYFVEADDGHKVFLVISDLLKNKKK